MTTTNTNTSETRDTVADRMETEGYEIGRPAHVHPDAVACDRETAAEATCGECGGAGLEFLPYRSRCRGERTYRVLAWCCRCDAALEM